MGLPLTTNQTISELEVLLYSFIPGSHFANITNSLGLSQYWQSGISKGPAISTLLKHTYEYKKDQFCSLIVSIVDDAISYGNRNGNPLSRATIERLNQLLIKLEFKIPELWDPSFLSTLYVERIVEETPKRNNKAHLDAFMKLLNMKPHERGFAFEKFLYEYFRDNELNPRGSFRNVGEQIDGSFEFRNEVYLLEAKWQNEKTSEADLLVFRGKVGSRAEWARGLFVSYAGFSEKGLNAFSKGKRTNMIGMTGEELSSVLLGDHELKEVFVKKIRIAAETGDFFYNMNQL